MLVSYTKYFHFKNFSDNLQSENLALKSVKLLEKRTSCNNYVLPKMVTFISTIC